MVDVPWIYRLRIRMRKSLVPIISDLVIIDDVQPRKLLRNSKPIRRSIHPTIFTTVDFGIVAVSVWNVYVDEVSEE